MAPRADSSEGSAWRSHLAGRRACRLAASCAGPARGADARGCEAEERVRAARACALCAIKRKKYDSINVDQMPSFKIFTSGHCIPCFILVGLATMECCLWAKGLAAFARIFLQRWFFWPPSYPSLTPDPRQLRTTYARLLLPHLFPLNTASRKLTSNKDLVLLVRGELILERGSRW